VTAAPGVYVRGTARVGGKTVFGPLDLSAPGGEWTCILGPSGVGKTTLLACLAGTADGVVLEGAAGADDGRPLAGRVALMAQSDLLMPWLSALDNVLLGDRLRGDAPRAGRAGCLLGRMGLEGMEGRKPTALSGGQRQRVALARTLIEDRPVVLLDEPFSALDVARRAQMQELAADVLSGRTVVHVTHDPAEAARLGSRTLILTPTGLREITPPAAPLPPRRPDATETLALTGRLTRCLLDAA